MSHIFCTILFLLLALGSATAYQGPFFVQAVNTESLAAAESVREQLRPFGNAHIHRQADRYIVRIGPLEKGKKAVHIRNLVKKIFPDAFITATPSETGPIASVPPAFETKTTAAGAEAVIPLRQNVAPTPTDRKPPPSTEISHPPIPEAVRIPATAPEALLKTALEAYETGRYDNALQRLSFFLSLYPQDKNIPSALFAVAGIQLEMKRPLSAIRIYSQILDQHPDTPEALATIVALGDISMLFPDLKPSIAITGAKWYRDPVMAYDLMLSKKPPVDVTERLLVKRISALRVKGRYREAYDACNDFLERYYQSRHRSVVLAALRSDIVRLMDDYSVAGDDLAVINILKHATRKELVDKNETDVLIRAARSYRRLGMGDEARSLLIAARPFAAGRTPQIDAALAEVPPEASTVAKPSPESDRWRLYEASRQQIRSFNLTEAEKTLAQLKGAGQDPFWSKIADFTMKEGAWTIKYKDHLSK